MMSQEMKVRYSKWPPWSYIIPAGNESKLDGVFRDVLDALAYALKYRFDTRVQPDHQYGSLQPDGNFSGMIGALQKQEVDIAGPFAISEQRATATDFSNCLGVSTLGIITGISSADKNMFLYANVFTWQVWLALLTSIIGLGFVAALIYNVTVGYKKEDQIGLLSQYFWVFWSYLVGQDGGASNHWAIVKIWNLQPFQILLAAWLLGPVINFSFSFQGSITSTFAVTKLRPIISDLDELAKKVKIIPVLSKGSAVQICFMGSKDHAHLWKRMEHNMIEFSPEAVQMTMKKIEKGTHILIVDYIYALTIASEFVKRTGRCSLQVEELLFCSNFVSLGIRKGTPSKTLRQINTRLTYIVQAKLTDRWTNRVFPNYTHCTKQPQDGIKKLNIKDIVGGFLIWGIGIVVSLLLLLTEILMNKREKKKSSSATSAILSESREKVKNHPPWILVRHNTPIA